MTNKKRPQEKITSTYAKQQAASLALTCREEVTDVRVGGDALPGGARIVESVMLSLK